MRKTLNCADSTWQTAAMLQVIKSPYLNKKSCNFVEIWYTTAPLELDNRHVTKCDILKIKMAHGRQMKIVFWP